MASHQLGLHVTDTANSALFLVKDISVYTDLIDVVCPQLLITLPGFQYSASISQTLLTEGFDLVLTACQLGVQNTNCDSEFNDLPDGVYTIQYSVSPNEYVNVEYNHLRFTKLLKQIKDLYCDLEAEAFLPQEEFSKRLASIRAIHDRLILAKYLIEDEHELHKGMEFFEEARNMLKKLNCKHC